MKYSSILGKKRMGKWEQLVTFVRFFAVSTKKSPEHQNLVAGVRPRFAPKSKSHSLVLYGSSDRILIFIGSTVRFGCSIQGQSVLRKDISK